MAKMLTGFNHNVRHRGRIFHIQTEDSGVNSPQIVTHLFVGGNIVATKKTSYADALGAPNLEEVVRKMMEEQHKEVLRNLVRGRYDETIAQRLGEPLPPPEAPVPAAQEEAARSTGQAGQGGGEKVTTQSTSQRRDSIFGGDLLDDASLDEVILRYLADDES